MKMKLRTVIFSGKVEIDNVPIYSCCTCSRSEVCSEIKPDLTGLIAQLGAAPDKQILSFSEWNEWAGIYLEASVGSKQPDSSTVERLIHERTDILLDLLLVARAMNDDEWSADINRRLTQLLSYRKLCI